jgi:hypothetical protein
MLDKLMSPVLITNRYMVDWTNIELAKFDRTNIELTNVEWTNYDWTNIELTNFEWTKFEWTNFELTNFGMTLPQSIEHICLIHQQVVPLSKCCFFIISMCNSQFKIR